ncbi:hypothetical protein PIB30_021715 [Stylosanthes scabra]|uniref:NmrA-like domain-containing protein n=1 Tax=Stylosanthes scabra TaxID=79078 RepID=A0ABU6SAD6_9FABA|nr:hypothetical protein [Stylosanthes scabra]
MAGKSKVLVIRGIGHLGKYIVEASSKAGHSTFALVRESSVSDPQKSNLIDSFKRLWSHSCLHKVAAATKTGTKGGNGDKHRRWRQAQELEAATAVTNIGTGVGRRGGE